MTKTLKKYLIGVLMCVFALSCMVTVGFANVKAEKPSALDTFIEYVQAFEGVDLEDEEALFVTNETDARNFAGIAKCAIYIYENDASFGGLSKDEKAGLDKDIVDLYLAVEAKFNKAYKALQQVLDDVIRSTADDKLVTEVLYKDKAVVDAAQSAFDALSDNEKAFVNKNSDNCRTLKEAQIKMAKKLELIQKAEEAINKIAYFYDGSFGPTTEEEAEIVVDSKETIDNAKEALKAIYGKEFSTSDAEEYQAVKDAGLISYDKYTAAVDDYNKIKSEVGELIDDIKAQYAKVEEGKTYYTFAKEIKALDTRFKAFETTANESVVASLNNKKVNDKTSLVTNTAKLKEMVDYIKELEEETFVAFSTAVGEIGEVKYTVASKNLIDAATTLFVALDKDVQANEKAAYAKETGKTYWINASETYFDAVNEYDKLKKEVDDLVKEIENLIENEKTVNVLDAFDSIQAKFGEFTAEQKTAFDAEKLTDVDGKEKTLNKIYSRYQSLTASIRAAVKPVMDAINEIPDEVVFSTEFFAKLDKAEKMYGALNDDFKKYVINYEDLTAKRAEYDQKNKFVSAWETAIKEIKLGEIDTANMDKVETAEEKWKAIPVEQQTVITDAYAVDKTEGFGLNYANYDAAVKERDALLTKISDLATKMGQLDKMSLEINEASEDYKAVKEGYEALNDNDKAYLEEKYATMFGNYEDTVIRVEANGVDTKIKAIGKEDPANVVFADAENIEVAVKAYSEASDDAKALVDADKFDDTYTYKQYLDACKKKKDDITAKLDAWVKSVQDFNVDGETVIPCSVDLVAVGTLEAQYSAFDDSEKDYVKTVSKNGKVDARELLDIIKSKSEASITSVDEYILTNTPATVKLTDLEKIQEIEAEIKKLHTTQIDKLANKAVFDKAKEKVTFATSFDAAVSRIEEQVENKHFSFEEKIIVDVLYSVYNAAGSELQGLVTKYEDLGKCEEKIAKALSENEDALAVVEKALKKAIKDGDDASADALAKAKKNLEESIKALDEKTADAIKALEDAFKAGDEATKAALTEAKKALEESIKALDEKTANALAEAKKALEESIKALDEKTANALADAKKALEDAIKAGDETSADALADAIKALEDAIEAGDEASAKALADAIKVLEDAIKAGDDASAKALADAIKALEDAIKAGDDASAKALAEAKEALEKALEEEKAARKADVEDLQNQLDTVKSIAVAGLVIAIVAVLAGAAGIVLVFLFKKKN